MTRPYGWDRRGGGRKRTGDLRKSTVHVEKRRFPSFQRIFLATDNSTGGGQMTNTTQIKDQKILIYFLGTQIKTEKNNYLFSGYPD